ncbi:hypothetical protein Tco_0732570 [Tanacetum coccineum]
MVVNVPYLLAQYLFRHAKGRKYGARLSGGHFVRCLTEHFGLVTKEGLRGLTMVVGELRMIDMDELIRLFRHPYRHLIHLQQLPSLRQCPQRMARLEEEAARGISQFLDATEATYTRYSETHVPYQRYRVRRRTDDASTLTALVDEDQPDP